MPKYSKLENGHNSFVQSKVDTLVMYTHDGSTTGFALSAGENA